MLKGGYLRVLTPVTYDGRSPVMTDEGKIKYNESHLHINAKKIMEAKNEKLPQHLKHIITIIPDTPPPTPKTTKVNAGGDETEPDGNEDEENDGDEDQGDISDDADKKKRGKKKAS